MFDAYLQAVVLTLALTAGMVSVTADEDLLTRAEVVVGDVTVIWEAKSGMTVQYKGVEAFGPYSAEFTVHDAKWTRAFYGSRKGDARATLSDREGVKVLTIGRRGEDFSYTKRVTVTRENKVTVEYEFQQTSREDAHLQLGWRPAVPWLDGATYKVVAQGKAQQGRMTYGKADRRVLWSGLRSMSFGSVFGTWHLTTSHDMTLYDDRDKGTFFLGWDQELEKGKQYKEVVELRFEPSAEPVGGVTVSDFQWSREAEEGYARVQCKLGRTKEGPARLKARLEAFAGEKQVARREASLALQEQPVPLDLKLSLGGPGRFTLRLLVANAADDTEVLRVQGLPVQAKAIFRFIPSLSLYTHEKQAELIIALASEINPEGLSARLEGPGFPTRALSLTDQQTAVPFDLAKVPDGRHTISCTLGRGADVIARAEAKFSKAPPKPNEVKIDYLTRGLIVNGKPFFPFGFYTHHGAFYDQEDPQYILKLEGAFKFNLICVYHNFSTDFRREQRPVIQAFLDEADAVGMRMHYDVRQLTDQEPTEEVKAALTEDVTAQRDAPALLCWYLSDEPAGRRIPPDRYIAHNAQMKELDPYHPTTVVFCVPGKAHEYQDAMDIMMVDPYPIPNGPVTRVADTVDLVLNATGAAMPIWCVPQAFGGGEGWGREPTPQEQRCMTYLAIVHGATGIQYFIRRPPHNNPFVDAMWAECRKMAAEIKELTPVLLSHEPAPEVTAAEEDPGLHLMARRYDGGIYVFCVNTDKQPREIAVQCAVQPIEPEAQVLFEDRAVPVSPTGEIHDIIEALGVRIYAYRAAAPRPNRVTLPADNLLHNGGFEQQTNVGFPDYYHVSYGNHPGASWGTDPLEAIEGRHALFIRCPADKGGPTVIAYPMRLKPGKYVLSFYVKADREGASVHFGVSGFKQSPSRDVAVGRQWQQLSLDFEVPENTRWVHLSLRPSKRGVIWADAVEVRTAQ